MLNGENIKFIADDMLGRLAKWLRILGYDVIYFHSINDNDLINRANLEKRILLTRDVKIAASGKAERFIFIEQDFYVEQLRQIFRLLSLKVNKEMVFSRCIICNESLNRIAKDNVKGKVPPFVFESQEEFITCDKCGKIYWKGTHSERVEGVISKLRSDEL